MNLTMKAALFASAVAFASGPLLAAGTHPVTGEALADEQVFTYRVLDEHTSVDPQIVEEVSGS
jgi:oligopeptide transport system substrate-binding protein